jgi:hypothetical protein
MTGDKKLYEPLMRALGYICQSEQKGGGWDYTELQTGRNDTSVTGWQVMALKSAHAAGYHVPWKTTYGIMRHFERVTDEEGWVGYTNEGTTRGGVALAAVGMLSNFYLGYDRNHPTIRKQAAILLQNLPAWFKLRGEGGRNHSMYYWYYATLAMYQMGGSEWEKWNDAIRDMLVSAQCAKGHREGSWDPDCYWARSYAGRIYSTALMTLTLEVYYRYLPMYETREPLGIGKALIEQLRTETSPSEKILLIRKLVLFTDKSVDKALKELLADENAGVRFTAAKFLAERGDASAIPFLEAGLVHTDPVYRFSAIRALEELDEPDTIPALIKALNDPLATNAIRASRALTRKTGADFGFRADALPEEKRKIVASWLSWWENNRGKLGSVPDLRGSVVAARDGGARVLVRLGENDPVTVGMQFKVFRGGKVVGYLSIQEVLRGGMAEAAVTQWELKGSPIAQGDKIGTRRVSEDDK